MTLHNTNVDLVNDNPCTKFGKILSIHSQDIEQKPNSGINQGNQSLAKLQKLTLHNTNVDLVNDNIYTQNLVELNEYSVPSFSRY